jgi:hypothetical protein
VSDKIISHMRDRVKRLLWIAANSHDQQIIDSGTEMAAQIEADIRTLQGEEPNPPMTIHLEPPQG